MDHDRVQIPAGRQGVAPAALLLSCVLYGYGAGAAAKEVAYVSNQLDGITVIDLATLQPEATIDMQNSGPRGLAVTPDGKYVLTANQKTSDVAVVDTATREVVRRVPVGVNPEFMRILPDGSKVFVTYEPSSTGKPPKGGAPSAKDEDEIPGEIAVIDTSSWKVVESIVGAPETEGIEFAPDKRNVVIANEGNDTLSVYDFVAHKLTRTVDLKPWGRRPRGVKLSPDGKHYAVTMESSSNFLILDDDFKVLKSVPTARGPNGVAFDPTGSRIVVAAARAGRLEVFDAASYKRLASVAVGHRCWHFTFTPDADRLLLACGRSNDVEVVNAKNYTVQKKIANLKLPWGIVTYPKTFGSLDAPQAPEADAK